jgi:hypothetical protein
MAIHPKGTFDYVGTIPEREPDGTIVCSLTVRDRRPLGTFEQFGCLVGGTPTLHITEAGLTPDPGPDRPRVLRSRLRLRARGRDRATVQAVDFHVDRGLVAALRANDALHLVRTASGDLAISVLRGNQLVAAVGAVTCVPLGDEIEASTPFELMQQAEAMLAAGHPGFHFPEMPVRFVVDGHAPQLFMFCNGKFGPFSVFVRHGWRRGVPGDGESVAISRDGLCNDVAARCSTMLLECRDGFGMAQW